MSPVGGSRHYHGAGLGEIGIWRCPSCGVDNTGPLTQGCGSCGAGKPGVAAPPPPPEPPARRYEPRSTYELGDPPRVSERTPDDPTYQSGSNPLPEMNEYQVWVLRHPDATLEQAFIAGYVEGIRAARRAQLAEQARTVARPVRQEDAMALPAEHKVLRTIVAALAFFADQVLAQRPEEVQSGEWISAEETARVIRQLQQQLTEEPEEEDVHAL